MGSKTVFSWLLQTGLWLVLGLGAAQEALAQVNGDYRSRQTGNWHTVTTWQVFNAGAFQNLEDPGAGAFRNVIPTSASGAIEIRDTHVVTLAANITGDQLNIANGGTLVVSAGIALTLANGAGVDLNIGTTGSLQVAGTVIGSNGYTHAGTSVSTVSFLAGSVYRHQYTTTEGVVPLANWNATSTLEISGFSSSIVATGPGNWSQAFGHVVYSCNQGPNTIVSFEGLLSSIQGDLIVSNTGANANNRMQLCSSQVGPISIGGSLVISNAARCYLGLSGNGLVVNVGRDFEISAVSTLPVCAFILTGNATINVGRDFVLSGASQTIFANSSSSVVDLNLSRNFSQVAGSVLSTKSGSPSSLRFMGVGTQSFSSTGVISSTVSLFVAVSATVDFGTSVFGGNGNVTVNGALRLGSLDAGGAYQSGASGGNIRATGTRVFAIGSMIEMTGSSGQFLAAAHPANASLTINNIHGVQMVSNVTLSQGVSLLNGDLSIGPFGLVLAGSFSRVAGRFHTNGNSSLTIQGTGTFSELVFAGAPATIRNLTVNRSGLNLPLNSDLIVTNSLSLLSSSVLNFSDNSLTLSGTYISSSAARLAANPSADLVIDGSGSLASFRFLPSGSNNRIRNWTINRSGSVTLGNGLNLFGRLLILSSGTTINTANSLILKSTDDQPGADASIGPLPTGSIINGTVTIERFISAVDNRDRFISSPIAALPVSQLQDDFAVTGNFLGSSFPCTGCLNNGPSLTVYDEPTPGTLDKGYKPTPVSGGVNTETLIVGRGYDAYMWNGVSDFVLDVTGSINSGTIGLTVSHTPSSPVQPTADGWNLVGNPFPSSIVWNNGPGWGKSNIDPTVWVWDVKARLWRSYNANTSTGNLSDGIIALGQAFWVYVPTASPASLSINEQAKSSIGPGSYYRQSSSHQQTEETMTIQLVSDASVDEAYLYLTSAEDSKAISSPKPRLGVESASLALVRESQLWGHIGVDSQAEFKPLGLSINSLSDSELHLRFVNVPKDKRFALWDKSTDQFFEIYEGLTLPIELGVDELSEGRYFLTLWEERKPKSEDALYAYPNPFTSEIFVNIDLIDKSFLLFDALGRNVPVFAVQSGRHVAISTDGLSNGVYFIKIYNRTGQVVTVLRVVKQ